MERLVLKAIPDDGTMDPVCVTPPEDDQLMRDLHRVTDMLLNPERYELAKPDTGRKEARRLRAAAGLDEE